MFARQSTTLRFFAALLLLLAAVGTACGDSADADSNNEHTNDALASETGVFEAHVTATPDPPATGENTLDVHLMDADGNALPGATLEVEPWMPGHGHGSPETPSVEEGSDGMYTVSNVVYSMPGHWEVRIDITHGDTTDRIVAEYDVQ